MKSTILRICLALACALIGFVGVPGNTREAKADYMPPAVVTDGVEVTELTATLNGHFITLGTQTAVPKFEWGTNTTYGNESPSLGVFRQPDAFYYTATDLLPGEIYHYRAFAIPSGGGMAVYGDDRWFTAGVIPPEVATGAATFNPDSLTFSGSISTMGSISPVKVWFEYGLTTTYGSATQPQLVSKRGPFSDEVRGLPPGTYHYRVKADDGAGNVVYGEDKSVIYAVPPAIITDTATRLTATSATLNAFVTSLGNASSVAVTFQYGPSIAYGDASPAIIVSSAGNVGFEATGLTPKTTYHYRAKADGGLAGVAYSPDLSFTTGAASAQPLTVLSTAASGITATSAVLNGSLISSGSAAGATVSFEYGTTTGYGSGTPPQALSGPGAVNASVTGLKANTTYHFRAKADGGAAGIAYGADLSFTTASPLSVATGEATVLTPDSATLTAVLASTGGSATVNASFEYGLSASYGSNTALQALSAAGPFSVVLTGLLPNSTYHFRAKADSGIADTVYGSDMTFKTLSAVPSVPPTVNAAAATSLTETTATLNGSLSILGSSEAVSVSFEYGPTASYGNATTPKNMTAAGTFSAAIGGLSPGQTYHFRARADGTTAAVAYSQDMTFSTTAVQIAPPALLSSAAVTVGEDGATLRGALTSMGGNSSVNVSFEYGTTTSYGSTTPAETMTATGSFTAAVSGLSPGRTYHFRARGDSAGGPVYGADTTFTTHQEKAAGVSPLVWVLGGAGILVVAALALVLIMKRGGSRAAAPPPPTPFGSQQDYVQSLYQLSEMRSQGLISEEEYETKRGALLRKMGGS